MSHLKAHYGSSARALEFLILTAARSGEVRGAKWHEIDFEQCLWIIPAERMKADAMAQQADAEREKAFAIRQKAQADQRKAQALEEQTYMQFVQAQQTAAQKQDDAVPAQEPAKDPDCNMSL